MIPLKTQLGVSKIKLGEYKTDWNEHLSNRIWINTATKMPKMNKYNNMCYKIIGFQLPQ